MKIPEWMRVSSNEVCAEAETGGDTLGFPFSLSLSNFFEKIRVSSLFQTSSAS
jgi:hypothetical protein